MVRIITANWGLNGFKGKQIGPNIGITLSQG